MNKYKKRVEEALLGYYKKQDPDYYEPRRKNEKPEESVVSAIYAWCSNMGWDVDIVEVKAKFNVETQMYTGRAASPGISDILGNTEKGLAVYIEVKAPDKRVGSALRGKQREFLSRKIETGCFAIMADSVEYLEKTWLHFITLSPEERKSFLFKELPEHKPRQLKF